MLTDLKEVIIDYETKKKCVEFGRSVQVTTPYSDTGQTDKNQVAFDHMIGKIAEFAVYEALHGLGVTAPDMEIYQKDDKGWGCDLSLPSGISIGVKSQSSHKAMLLSNCVTDLDKMGPSWLFQADPNGRIDACLRNPSHTSVHVFVEVDMSNPSKKEDVMCRIWGYILGTNLSLMLKTPIFSKYKSCKMAIYSSDLDRNAAALWACHYVPSAWASAIIAKSI